METVLQYNAFLSAIFCGRYYYILNGWWFVSELTEKQSKVLQFIREMIMQRRRPPTLREIQTHMQARNITSVRAHLFFLMKKNKIRLLPGIARGIELVEVGQ